MLPLIRSSGRDDHVGAADEEVPGAVLYYDVRSNDSSTQPVLLLIESPKDASRFGTLAGHFADRTVVTYALRRSAANVPTAPASLRPTSTRTTCPG